MFNIGIDEDEARDMLQQTIDERVGSTYRFKKSDVDDFMDHITSQMDITNNDLKSLKKVKSWNYLQHLSQQAHWLHLQ